MSRIVATLISALFLAAGLALAQASGLPRSASKPGTEVYIVSPADGATVNSPVRVVFGLRGMGVAPAGVNTPGTGHHHLMIDTELAKFDQPVPADDQHKHFGGGQTETSISLAPGEHTLQLVLGDYLHIPHEPPVVSKTITITVR